MPKYIMAHDLGTSGNKATLYTTEGELVNSVVARYETFYEQERWAEQNPEDWWKAVCESKEGFTGRKASLILTVAVCTQADGWAASAWIKMAIR